MCQRCLAAANPFPGATIDTGIPAVLLLALPALLALTLAVGITDQILRRGRRSREAASQLLRGAQRRRMHGHDVSVVSAERPFAVTFPARHGGIVVSTGAAAVLDHDELAAVLAHEHAHLSQHHHAVSSLVASVGVFLRWVPLIAAAADALPQYLEIAADNDARRAAGTPALVSALIKLGERVQPADQDQSFTEALHATGPERIRQLVRPVDGRAGALPAMIIGSYLVALAVASAAVTLPYAAAALNGCA
ncbi:Zn-dependent protease with chaperone function [Marisediminicola sp. UYEF4]|uniref:M56 family metallopeptidase n=1 Tax=Marisediminicola sp. UYEF4 TaxID=1756384 RepID=UPI00339A08DB